jgi:thiamine-phosphate pyrophosphorylase
MTKSNLSQVHASGLERLIDANLNRLGEGIRVIEDINRYIHNNKILTNRLKSVRHKLQKAHTIDRVIHRDVQSDVQKKSTPSELIRLSLNDLIIANFLRTQESSRVLEESFKLKDIELSELFKSIRYELYEIESIYFETDRADIIN